MRNKIIAGNWKMHGTRASVDALLAGLKAGVRVGSKQQMIVFPPYVFLEQAQHALKGSPIQWGAQNMAAEVKGAYTGEVSAEMIKDFGCHYVLIGHSERRQLFGEGNEIVAKKFKLALNSALRPVLCLGETLEQRKGNLTQQIVIEQLQTAFAVAEDKSQLKQAMIAYEPVWAIGTGMTATPAQAQEVHALLREQIAVYDKEIARQMPILYGGSVKAANAQELFAMPDIDGGLVGGASLEAQEFLQIFNSVS